MNPPDFVKRCCVALPQPLRTTVLVTHVFFRGRPGKNLYWPVARFATPEDHLGIRLFCFFLKDSNFAPSLLKRTLAILLIALSPAPLPFVCVASSTGNVSFYPLSSLTPPLDSCNQHWLVAPIEPFLVVGNGSLQPTPRQRAPVPYSLSRFRLFSWTSVSSLCLP